MKFLFKAAATCLLAACTATPPIQYFQLPDSHFILPSAENGEIAVRIHLAQPLKQRGLVYQTDDKRLHFANRHLWAEPLEHALAARFANELNRLSSNYHYLPASRTTSRQTVDIYIEGFHGSYRGHTVIQGYSRWPDGQGRNFKQHTPQQGDGYDAMLQSLSDGLTAAARHIVR